MGNIGIGYDLNHRNNTKKLNLLALFYLLAIYCEVNIKGAYGKPAALILAVTTSVVSSAKVTKHLIAENHSAISYRSLSGSVYCKRKKRHAMGAFASISLTSEEIGELVDQSHFSNEEIVALYKRFVALDRKKTGTLTRGDLELIPELSMSPIFPRIVSIMDKDHSDSISFKKMVQTLSRFHHKASDQERIQVLFECYDVDGDGVISEDDLIRVLKMLVGSFLNDEQLMQIVRKTMQESSPQTKSPPCISKETFTKELRKEDIESLTIHFEEHLDLED
eukprot:g9587.t1